MRRLTGNTKSQETATQAPEATADIAVYDHRLPVVSSNEIDHNGWPIDLTFSRKYDITLCDEFDLSGYKAVYIDLEKYLRITKTGVVEVSYNKGTKWQTYEANAVSIEDFLYWMACHEAPSMTGYSVSDMLDRLDNGACVNHAFFSDGNEIYFVFDDNGVYLIPYMSNKIASIWIDGQRMSITFTTSASPMIISDDMLRSFYNLLVSTAVTSQDKAEQDYTAKIQWLRSNLTADGNSLFEITPNEHIPDNSNNTQSMFTAPVASNPNIEIINTLDDAVQWYLQEIEAHEYLEGDHFSYSYRILDTTEESDTITIYAHTLCEWISVNGESVSGGAGLSSITFRYVDNTYHYLKHKDYPIPEGDEIPQKVIDIESDGSFFGEMRDEVDKAIADFLSSE